MTNVISTRNPYTCTYVSFNFLHRTRSGGARHRHLDPAVSPTAIQLPNTPALCGQGLHTRASSTRPYTTAAESSPAASNQRAWTVLAGTAPPDIRMTVACRIERTQQTTDARHRMFHHRGRKAASRLKSRKSFIRTVTPLDSYASSSRLRLWKDIPTDVTPSVKIGLEVAECLPAGSGEDWLCWGALNRLGTRVGRAKTVVRRWGYLHGVQSVDCDCGEPQTMAHLLSCRLLDEACTADDLATVTERAKAYARNCEKSVWRTRQKKKTSWIPHFINHL